MQLFRIEDLIKREIYLHLLFWVFYLAFPMLKFTGNDYSYLQWIGSNSNVIFLAATVYTCYFLIFPWENKLKIVVLIGFLLSMTLLGAWASKWLLDQIFYQLGNYSYFSHALGILGEYVFVSLIFFSFYSFKKNNALSHSLKAAQLNNLKAQINPHFLLNTLNNIYAYLLENDEKAPELVLKLADNFKYVLREGKMKKVSIQADWQHIEDYIYINRLRWEQKIHFDVQAEIAYPGFLISPLILITFVENAVKYTSKLTGENTIRIRLQVSEKQLVFHCTNPYDPDAQLSPAWESSGVGLKNTKERLKLLYGQDYDLKIEDHNHEFQIRLKLNYA